MEAQRFPADYDGIISGAPANDWTHNFAGFIWDQQALEGDAQIPAAKMTAIENAALEACDALDGVKDGVIDDPRKCHFDPSALLCKGGDFDSCLIAPQVAAPVADHRDEVQARRKSGKRCRADASAVPLSAGGEIHRVGQHRRRGELPVRASGRKMIMRRSNNGNEMSSE
jgi:hypothetical protein